jgi:hypothetical protein
MNKNLFSYATIVVFCIAGLLHLWRVIKGFDLRMGEMLVPLWVSFVVVVVIAVLIYGNVKLLR